LEAFRQEYNNYRPYSSLDYLTPVEFAKRYYKRNKEKQAIQTREKAGSLSFQVVLILGAPQCDRQFMM